MSPFRHILVPVDFGDATEPAIKLALSIADADDIPITLVHSFDISVFAAASPFAPPVDVEPILAAAERELRMLRERTQARHPRTDAVFRRGPPYDAILEVAQSLGCDLIVVGTHGRRGLSRALLGSVAERVVRLSTIPVLTVHPATATHAKASAA